MVRVAERQVLVLSHRGLMGTRKQASGSNREMIDMRLGAKHGFGIGCALVAVLVVACSVTVMPDGTTFGLTIAGTTVAIHLGDEGRFEVTADGPAVQKSFAIQLFDETPTDQPIGANLVLQASSVSFIEDDASDKQVAAQDGADLLCDVDIYMAPVGTEDPCADGIYVGTYTIMRMQDRTIFVNGEELPIASSLLDAVRSGVFTLCLSVKSRRTGIVLIENVHITYDEDTGNINVNTNSNDNSSDVTPINDNTSDNINDNVDNTNDNTADNTNDNVDDNSNDNTADNVNDNVDDNTNDNVDPVNPLDPDGDGVFDAQVCDDNTSLQITATEREYGGSEGNVSCKAYIHFKNVGTHNIVIWWHVHKEVPATGTVTEDGWYATGLGPGEETTSIDPAWLYSEQNDTLLHITTDEVMVARDDGEYDDGCRWLSEAIREDDSNVDLSRIEVADMNPCE